MSLPAENVSGGRVFLKMEKFIETIVDCFQEKICVKQEKEALSELGIAWIAK